MMTVIKMRMAKELMTGKSDAANAFIIRFSDLSV
jgi:hypothetical protein